MIWIGACRAVEKGKRKIEDKGAGEKNSRKKKKSLVGKINKSKQRNTCQ